MEFPHPIKLERSLIRNCMSHSGRSHHSRAMELSLSNYFFITSFAPSSPVLPSSSEYAILVSLGRGRRHFWGAKGTDGSGQGGNIV